MSQMWQRVCICPVKENPCDRETWAWIYMFGVQCLIWFNISIGKAQELVWKGRKVHLSWVLTSVVLHLGWNINCHPGVMCAMCVEYSGITVIVIFVFWLLPLLPLPCFVCLKTFISVHCAPWSLLEIIALVNSQSDLLHGSVKIPEVF